MECLLLKLYHNATKKEEKKNPEKQLRYDYSNDKRDWAKLARISDWEKANRKAKREARKNTKPQKCGVNKKDKVKSKHHKLQHERRRLRRQHHGNKK